MSVAVSLRVASILSWIMAIGLGIPCLMAIRNLSTGRDIPRVFGYPAYGGGAFERRGMPTNIPLILGFLAVCILEGIAASLLWEGQRAGAVLALALLIPGGLYWWGFDLPYPPIIAVIQLILLILGWSSLR